MTTISGPISTDAGSRPRPWSMPLADLEAIDYVAEEFFLEGDATRFELVPGTEYTADGHWDARRAGTAPFRTRFLVVRPRDAANFNGNVAVQWLNVTARYELGTADNDEILDGWAWVGVSAQKIGIDGSPPGAAPYSGRQAGGQALKLWDPQRYGTLEHPGDEYSFDIFSQVARAIHPDTMGGLVPQRILATGASQSGARLITYINAVHPVDPVFSGFMPTIISGWGPPLEGAAVAPTGAPAPLPDGRRRGGTTVRDDLDVPVLWLNTECETEATYRSRRDDSDLFRFWEVAGAPHAVAIAPADTPRPGGRIDNPLVYRPVAAAAYAHLARWMADGTPAPSQPRIEFSTDAESGRPTVVRDEHGNAVGGIRLPEMAAPVAEYRGRDDGGPGLTALYGNCRPFAPEELRALYPSVDAYRKLYAEAVDHLVATGAVRPEDADGLKAAGDSVPLDL